jgi:CRP-like cAMP-binding protein
LQQFRRLAVPEGTPLMDEGDEDASLICIADGLVDIETGGLKLGRAGPGELIGEMALFGSGMRMASAKTAADSVLLLLDRAAYERLRDRGNLVAKAVEDVALTQLVDRLRDITQRMAALSTGTAAANITPDPGVFRRVAKLFGGGGGRSWAWGVDKKGTLASSIVFQGVSDAALTELAGQMSAAKFANGHFICTQGEYGREVYVLVSGLVEVMIALDEEKVEALAQLSAGDVFGMGSVLDDHPRMASCVARGEVICLTIDQVTFNKEKALNTPAGSALRTALIRSLIDQLAYANGQLALLDFEKKRKTGSFMTTLLRARAATEAPQRRGTAPTYNEENEQEG